jgi:hypothetical protein
MNQIIFATVVPTCAICHKPAPLETAKTDECGHVVHEECYVFKMRLIEASIKPQRPPAIPGQNK